MVGRAVDRGGRGCVESNLTLGALTLDLAVDGGRLFGIPLGEPSDETSKKSQGYLVSPSIDMLVVDRRRSSQTSGYRDE